MKVKALLHCPAVIITALLLSFFFIILTTVTFPHNKLRLPPVEYW